MQRKRKQWTSAAARRIMQFAGGAPTIDAAVGVVAGKLLRDVAGPPTDLDALKDRLNVKRIEPIDDLPISGELRSDGKGFVVVYSAGMSEGRRRFTIAHELGHAVFEQTGSNCPRTGRELEQICDKFASEFLMPRGVFRDRIGNSVLPVDVFRLAREFRTSTMATAVRCRQFLGVSVFQIKNGDFEWGIGLIRQRIDLRAHLDELYEPIASAMNGNDGDAQVYLGKRRQSLRWTCLKGQRRALFVLEAPGHQGAAVTVACDEWRNA